MSDKLTRKRTGICPQCGGTFSLRKNGTLRVHGYGVHIYYATGPECPGSGELPEEVVSE